MSINKKKKILLVTVLNISMLFIFISFFMNYIEKNELKLAYVRSLSFQKEPIRGLESIILISGGFPDSCHKLHSHEINIDYHNMKVNIILWEIVQGDGCWLEPYEYILQVIVIFPFSGVWVVACNNKNISVPVF